MSEKYCLASLLLTWMLIECTFCKFTDNTKLGGVADAPEGWAVIHRDLGRLEKRADRNLTKFIKGKCKVLPQGRKNPMHHYTLRPESSFVKNLVIVVDKLTMS